MLGIVLLAGFCLSGVVIADSWMQKRSGLVRLWLGLCFGLMLMMWLPSLYAYALRFTALAQWLALLTAGVFAVLSHIFLRKERRKTSFWGDMPKWLPVALVVPLLVLSVYLQFTHTLREVNGALHVGQSTYGDLCLHLGIATGLRDAAYPAQYTLIQDTLLGYPFLMDALSASMLVLGSSLQLAFVLPGSLMMGLVYLGFVLFAWELTHRKAAVVVSFLLMFLNGGLGFLYTFDGVWKDPTMLENVFTGFYQTPTNMPALNLRWVNVVCDMMVPQRTLLGGWTMLVPSLYMLVLAVRENERRLFAVLGLWAGAMPMIHTHSFLGLALVSAGALFVSVRSAGKENLRAVLANYGIYVAVAAVLALPQLFTWAIPQTAGGGSLGFRFNWVNFDTNTGRLIDGYFWFWIKNVGLVYLFMLPAALGRKGAMKALCVGALIIYAIAEFIQFQPNEYDNNKLFYVAFMVMLPVVSDYLVSLWDRLKGVRGRCLFAGAFMAVSLLSGSLSIAREVVSDYTLFSADEVEAAQFIEEHTDRESVFLTGDQHNNAVNALAGRQIICGTGSYLYFHGVNYLEPYYDFRQMYQSPAQSEDLFEKYGVDYVYISNSERFNGGYTVDEMWFMENADLVFGNGSVMIYRMDTEEFTATP